MKENLRFEQFQLSYKNNQKNKKRTPNISNNLY